MRRTLATTVAMATMALLVLMTVLIPSAVQAQGISIAPTPTTSVPAPTETNTPTTATNCTTLITCKSCAAASSCGWCSSGSGYCIPAFNYMAVSGNGPEVCYGQVDSYYWMTCSVGARTMAIMAIAGGIMAVFVVGGLVICLAKIRRRTRGGGDNGAGTGAFSRMVDDFEKRYPGKGPAGQSKASSAKSSSSPKRGLFK
ncbi:hypothetical protein BC828DRAFT_405035 [Blastocladiella britannica]|nr:hypothetical protein BC828DRAFT_405035 [Blastocladiella britannica]